MSILNNSFSNQRTKPGFSQYVQYVWNEKHLNVKYNKYL